MTYLILGASGKIGKAILKELINLTYIDNLAIQFNSNFSFLSELGINEIPNNFPSKITLKDKSLTLYKVNFSNLDEVLNFARDIQSKFTEINVMINCLSTFVESPIKTEMNKINNILDINFKNQSLFLREIQEILKETFMVQFLDYSVTNPYSKKYFWYSVSKYCMFGFIKTFEKYTKEKGYKTKFLYVFPRIAEDENQIQKLLKMVMNSIIKKEEGEIFF